MVFYRLMHFFLCFLFGAQTSCHFKNRLHSQNVNTLNFFFFPFHGTRRGGTFLFFFRFMCFCHIAFVLQWTVFLFKQGNSPVVLKCSCTSPVTLNVIFVSVNSRMVKKLYASCSTLVNVRLLLLLLLLCFCPSFSTICFLVEGMNLFFYFFVVWYYVFFSLFKELWTTKFIKASVT